MPTVKMKSGARSQAKPSTKITISLPDELLGWCDVMAGARHLERNDVIRQAISLGLIGMQAENMRLSGRGDEVDAWAAAQGFGSKERQDYAARVGGIDGFIEKIDAGRAADAERASKQS